MFRYGKILFFCTMYIVLSGGLINFNKFLVHEGRFPHPMALTAIHMFTSFVLTSIILTAKPSMMPSVDRCRGKLLDLYKHLIPIGFFFAVVLYGSNKAIMYCSVAFLQFMKETNVVFVFLFSAIAGLQTVNRQRLFVIAWVISGSTLCVSGELNFVLAGFVLQAVAQFAECLRAVIAEMILTGSDYKLDSLSYAFFISPVCLVVLIIGNIVTWNSDILPDAAAMWYLLVPNACIAVCLNITIAQVIKETSAVGFMITGIVKDIILVCFSSAVFHDTIQRQQWCAFMLTLSGVFFWSYMKIAPRSGLVTTFEKMLGVGSWPCPGEPLGALEAKKAEDGKTRQIIMNASCVRGPKNEVLCVLGVAQDVTEAKAARAEKCRLAEHYDRFLEAACAPVLALDLEGRVLVWNMPLEEATGHKHREAVGKPLVADLVAEDAREKVQQILDQATRGVEASGFELPLAGRDGRSVVLVMSIVTEKDPEGKATRVVLGGHVKAPVAAAGGEPLAGGGAAAEDLSRLVEFASAPIFAVGMDGCVTEWNGKVAEMTQFSKADAVGKSLVEVFVREEQRSTVRGVVAKAYSGSETAYFDVSLAKKDGTNVDILLNVSPRRDAGGKVTGAVGLGLDISIMKGALTESRLVSEDHSRIIESANAPIFGVDVDGRISVFNRKAADLTRYSKEEAIGRPATDFVAADCIQELQSVLSKAYRGTETADFELVLMTKDSQRIDILLNATPRRDSRGNVTGVVGVGQDITHLRRVVTESKTVADDLSRLIETANAPIFGVDVNGLVTEWNRKAAQLTLFSKEEAVGRNLVNDFIRGDYQKDVQAVLTQACSGSETANFEFPLMTKDNQRIEILLNATPRRDGNGKVTGVVGVGQDITHLQKVLTESKTIADDLSRLIETANAPIFGVDVDGRVTEWNRKAAELTLFTKEETLGRNLVTDFITEDYRKQVQAVLTQACAGSETANFEFPLMTKDNKRIDVLLNATPRRDGYGNVTGVVGVGQDITHLQKVLTESKTIADDLSRLIETANAPIFGVDVDGRVTEWNRKAAELTLFTKEETLGRNLVTDFITEDYRKQVQAVLTQACAGSETANFEFPLMTKDNKRIDVLLNATPRRDGYGNVTGVVGVGQDITHLQKVLTESKTIADDLSRLIETANAPIFGVDVDGRVTEWNRKAAELTLFTKEETLGRKLVEDFITEDYRKQVQAVLTQACAGSETANFEFPLMTKDNKRIDVLLNATPRRDGSGNVTGVVGVGQDITHLQKVLTESKTIADDLSRLIETANAPIFGVDVDGRVTEWNRKAAELTLFSKEETMGRNLVTDFITEDYRKQVQAVLTQACAGSETANFEFPLMTKDNKRIDVLLNATPRRDGYGNVTGVVGVGQDITHLQKVLTESKTIADDLSRLIETANAPIFGVDVDGRVTEWNRKAAELTLFSKEETLGRNLVTDFITEEYRKDVQAVLTQACAGSETANFEFPLMTKDNKRIDVLLNATPRRDGSGNVTGVVGVGQDITHLQKVLTESKTIADDLSRLIETANAPIFGVDVDGRVTEWNRKAAELTLFSKEETLGRNLVTDFITEDYRKDVQAVLTQACAGSETANFEFPLMTKDNKRIDVLLNATPRRDGSGNVTGVVGVGQDITHLQKVLTESKTIADDLSRLIETANAPIFGVDVDGRVTEWNRKAAELTLFSKEETLGRNLVTDFITEDYRKDVQAVLTQACAGSETANFEFPLMTKDNKRIDVLLNATPRRDGRGNVTGVVGVGQDITHLQKVLTESKTIADDHSRLIETANAPIFGVDVDGRVTVWNRKAAELTLFSKEETLGRNLVKDFITEDYRKDVQAVLTQACAGSETANFEFPLMTKDNQRIDVLLNATPRRDGSGNVTGVVGVGQDITHLQKVLTESKTIADDLSRLIETANAPIFGVDVDGRVTEWNRKAAELTLFSKEETLGRNLVTDFITEDYRNDVQAVLTQACAGSETANFEFPLMTKDNKRIDVLLNATPRRDGRGNVTGVVGVGQDITHLQKVLTESKTIADDLSRLIETANAPIFGVDVDGRVTEWNRKAAELTLFTKEETLGRKLVEDFITEDYRKQVQAVLTQACAGSETANFEFPLMTKDNKRIDVLLNATPRRDGYGNVTGVVGVGQDITHLQKVLTESKTIADDLSRLIETANAPIFGVDVDGRVTEWNRKAAELTLFSKEETLGRNLVTDFITEDYRKGVQAVLTQACSGSETANFEFPLMTKDNKRIDVLLNATPRRDGYGNVTGVVGVGQDITHLQKVLTESKTIADDLSRLIETANAPIFGVDVDGRVTEWNRKAADLTLFSKEETLGRNLVTDFITEDYRKDVQAVLTQACAGSETANFEFPLMTKDSREMYQIVVLFSLCPKHLKCRALTGPEAALSWLKLGYGDIWSSVPVSGHGAPRARATPTAAQGSGEPPPAAPAAGEQPDSKRIDVLLNATPRRDGNGKVTGVVGVGQDITHLQKVLTESRTIADDLSRLIETANAPIFGVDVNGRVTEWNRKAAELTLFSKEETMGRNLVKDFITEDYRKDVQAVLTQACSGSETANFEFPLMTKDNQRIDVLLNATPRRDGNGNVTGVVGVGQDITHLQKVLTESKTIADDLSRLIETANAPIFGVDVDGRVTEWNRKAAELTLFSKEETLGRFLVKDFITEDYRKDVQAVLTQACAGSETANFEFPLMTKDNKRIDVLLNATPRRDGNGNVTGVVGVGQDITHLQKVLTESKTIADDLSRLIESANAPIFGVDVDGRVTEWNRKAAELTMFPKDYTLGKNLVAEFTTEDYKQSVQLVLTKALSGSETANFEFPLVTRDGNQIEILLNATPRRDAVGTVTGVVGVGQDITQMKNVMTESKTVAEDLSRLIETANAPIFGVDADGRVTEWNRKAAELTMFSQIDAIGENLVSAFITADYREQVQAVLTQALQGSETANFEFPLMTKDGQGIDILLNATPRRDAAGKVTGVVGVGQDITNMRKALIESKTLAEDLSRLIQTANAPIFGVDTAGRVTEWNRKAADLTMFPKEETLGAQLVKDFIGLQGARPGGSDPGRYGQ
ncbi:unnamed protein product [Prorocentrum cordatum]|uniref:histidine kinase n=1 Tax=Prorocentrum cordatum TaxID=2364126 RepID=A0ABN9XRV2_9DINO|nr:unnamed protein product [Polarella glacialis]